jgi:Flp pilus assembly protein TadD
MLHRGPSVIRRGLRRTLARLALAMALAGIACHRSETPSAPQPGPVAIPPSEVAPTRGPVEDAAADDDAPVPLPGGYVPRPPGTLTFTRDVAPIVFQNCAPCHRSAGVAPFELTTHAHVTKRGKQIRKVTSTGYMPPWLPEPGQPQFAGERRLNATQLGTLWQWIDEGLAEGDPADLPPMPTWPEGWLLGPPDLVLQPAEPYTVRAEGPDLFRNLVLPVPLQRTRYVRAIDVRPGNPRVVHHVTIEIAMPSARERDARDPGPGFEGMSLADSRPPPGHLAGWTPGRMARLSDEDMAWPLEPGTDLLVQLHLRPSGKPESVQPSLGLYLTDRPPTRLPVILMLRNDAIDIPPGVKGHVVEDRLVLPVPVTALAISPHAHFLASSMEVFATLPDASRTWLLRIDDWDFNWQDRFTYARPIPLPRGAEIVMRYTFDNTGDNPQNPNDPPRRVVFGPESSDEMATLALQVLPQDAAGRAALDETLWRRQIDRDPRSWEAHHTLATILLSQQRLAEAVPHLEQAVAINPLHALGHFDLGVALAQAGRMDDAIASYGRALQADPSLAAAHRNLAQLLVARGDGAAAVLHLRTVRRLRPDDIDARFDLGAALARLGDLRAAEAELRAVVEAQPDAADARRQLSAVLARSGDTGSALAELRRTLQPGATDAQAHYELGLALESSGAPALALAQHRQAMQLDGAWAAPALQVARILISRPDPAPADVAEALALASRAADLTGQRNPIVLDTLAACHATAGHFQEAVGVARRALDLAHAQDPQLAQRIAQRLAAYQQAARGR